MRIQRKNKRNKRIAENNVWSGIWHLGVLLLFFLLFVLENGYKPIWNFDWRGISANVQKTTLEVEERGTMKYGFSEFKGHISPHNETSKWLRKNATDEELNILLSFPNSLVKSIAYEKLLRNSCQNNYVLMQQLLNDTTSFYCHHYGCLVETKLLSEYMFKYRFAYRNGMDDRIIYQIFHRYGISENETNDLIKLYEERIAKRNEYLILADNSNQFRW